MEDDDEDFDFTHFKAHAQGGSSYGLELDGHGTASAPEPPALHSHAQAPAAADPPQKRARVEPYARANDFFGDDNPEYVRTKAESDVPVPRLDPEVLRKADANSRRPGMQMDSKFKRLLEKQGWQEGKGLGAKEQGRATAIEDDGNVGRIGLGFQSGIVRQVHDVNDAHVPIREKEEWIAYGRPYDPARDFSRGFRVGPPEGIAGVPIDYSAYANQALVDEILRCKTRFDVLDDRTFLRARKLSNPYELVGKWIFQNRAAMKMVNMDVLADLTDLKHPERKLMFADVCAGPGGFTEYVYYKRKTTRAQGFGFTLAGAHDWRLDKFNPESPHDNFKPFYGRDGTGDVTKNENVQDFARVVHAQTGGVGVDLMMADGGESVEGQENMQEWLMRQLVLCQFMTMFAILKKGGDFVCKVFDVYRPFTVGLVYLLYVHFERVWICKPVTSRPANSERYIICKGLRERTPRVLEYLYRVNETVNELERRREANRQPGDKEIPPGDDVTDIVEPSEIDPAFVEYLRKRNNEIARNQIKYLDEIWRHVEDPNRPPVDQDDIRERCLREWGCDPERGQDQQRSSFRGPGSKAPPSGGGVEFNPFETGDGPSSGGSEPARPTNQLVVEEAESIATKEEQAELMKTRVSSEVRSKYSGMFAGRRTATPPAGPAPAEEKKGREDGAGGADFLSGMLASHEESKTGRSGLEGPSRPPPPLPPVDASGPPIVGFTVGKAPAPRQPAKKKEDFSDLLGFGGGIDSILGRAPSGPKKPAPGAGAGRGAAGRGQPPARPPARPAAPVKPEPAEVKPEPAAAKREPRPGPPQPKAETASPPPVPHTKVKIKLESGRQPSPVPPEPPAAPFAPAAPAPAPAAPAAPAASGPKIRIKASSSSPTPAAPAAPASRTPPSAAFPSALANRDAVGDAFLYGAYGISDDPLGEAPKNTRKLPSAMQRKLRDEPPPPAPAPAAAAAPAAAPPAADLSHVAPPPLRPAAPAEPAAPPAAPVAPLSERLKGAGAQAALKAAMERSRQLKAAKAQGADGGT